MAKKQYFGTVFLVWSNHLKYIFYLNKDYAAMLTV